MELVVLLEQALWQIADDTEITQFMLRIRRKQIPNKEISSQHDTTHAALAPPA
jgi:hypothetical protein